MILALVLAANVWAADDCATLISRAEKTSDSSPAAAEPIAKKAIDVCAAAHVRSARPYMVLATCADRGRRYPEVVVWSQKALQEEPGLALAYMDMCSAYMNMRKYDQAVQTCKKGLTKPNEWSAKINFNIGLALFKKAVEASKFNDALQSEPYFKESRRLDPNIAQNYFYLGTLEENVKQKPAVAVPLYDQACKLGDQGSCQALSRAKTAAASAVQPRQAVAATQSQPIKGEPASLEEEKLWDVIADGYKKKGVPAESVKQTIESMKKSMAQMPSAQRTQALQTMAKQMH